MVTAAGFPQLIKSLILSELHVLERCRMVRQLKGGVPCYSYVTTMSWLEWKANVHVLLVSDVRIGELGESICFCVSIYLHTYRYTNDYYYRLMC